MNTQDQEPIATGQIKFDQMPAQAIKVISNPVGFYQEMPKSGGLLEPLVFMVVLSVVSGLITAVTSLFGLGAAGAIGIVLALLNVGGERAGRQMQNSLEDWQAILEEQR